MIINPINSLNFNKSNENINKQFKEIFIKTILKESKIFENEKKSENLQCDLIRNIIAKKISESNNFKIIK